MQIFLDDAGHDAGKVLTSVETWFNASMERVAGWYKRKLQILTFFIAVLGVGALNADTLQIVKTLSTDPAIRQLVVTQAQEHLKQHPAGDTGQALLHTGGGSNPARSVGNKPLSSGGSKDQAAPTPNETIRHTVEQLQQFGIPLGWQAAPKARELPNKIIGLLLTVLAVSLGAPFWFDILSRVSKIRSTGATPADEAQKVEKAEK
jgi:hypothetical protein